MGQDLTPRTVSYVRCVPCHRPASDSGKHPRLSIMAEPTTLVARLELAVRSEAAVYGEPGGMYNTQGLTPASPLRPKSTNPHCFASLPCQSRVSLCGPLVLHFLQQAHNDCRRGSCV